MLGAGMAGLTAALALLRRGHKVTVIEYQNRVGGRVLSVPLKGGQFTEAGAGHLRSNHPYALSYVHQFKLPLVAFNDGQPRYLIDGKTAAAANLTDRPWDLAPNERNVTLTSTLNRYFAAAGLDTDTVLDPRWPDPETLARLENTTGRTLLKGVGASDAFIKLLNVHEGMNLLDTTAIYLPVPLAYHLGDKNLFRIEGGNDRLPNAMADVIGRDNIILDSPITVIDQSGTRVRVATKGGREFSGDVVISTIPSTVLGDVEVRPGWSPGKQRLIREARWANTVKVVAQTQTPAWLSKGIHGWPMAASDRSWERVIDITGNEPGGHGNVFFYLNGGNADALLKRPAQDRTQATIDAFRADMPDLFDEVITSFTYAWSEQPWVKGSVAIIPLGGAWMVRDWQTPEGRIHFAGDFTTFKMGWIEGAIEAGLRAARQIDPEAMPEGRPSIRQER